jgi:hypothetical protein
MSNTQTKSTRTLAVGAIVLCLIGLAGAAAALVLAFH